MEKTFGVSNSRRRVSMKFKIAAVALFASVALICSESNGDLLSRMLGRGGCGGCQAASSCCDTPAPACGRSFGISINLNIGMPGRLFGGGGGGCGGGCGAVDAGGCGGGCGGGGLLSGGGLLLSLIHISEPTRPY